MRRVGLVVFLWGLVPFDLGTVVVREALGVNPETAQAMVKSDPILRILYGIPLDLKDVRVELNRQASRSTRPVANR